MESDWTLILKVCVDKSKPKDSKIHPSRVLTKQAQKLKREKTE